MRDLTAVLARIEERTHTLADVDAVRQALALDSVLGVRDLGLQRYQRLVGRGEGEEPVARAVRLCVAASRVAELVRMQVFSEGFVSVAEVSQALGEALRRAAELATAYAIDLGQVGWADVARARGTSATAIGGGREGGTPAGPGE